MGRRDVRRGRVRRGGLAVALRRGRPVARGLVGALRNWASRDGGLAVALRGRRSGAGGLTGALGDGRSRAGGLPRALRRVADGRWGHGRDVGLRGWRRPAAAALPRPFEDGERRGDAEPLGDFGVRCACRFAVSGGPSRDGGFERRSIATGSIGLPIMVDAISAGRLITC